MPDDLLEGKVSADRKSKVTFCPSSQPTVEQSLILGSIERNALGEPHVRYLKHPVKVTDGTLAAFTNAATKATEVFRFTAPCQKIDCRNWNGSACRVGQQVIKLLPIVSSQLPECRLRPVCQWFDQEGEAACLRCPQVVTNDPDLEKALNGESRAY
jgi:hypothetical protein